MLEAVSSGGTNCKEDLSVTEITARFSAITNETLEVNSKTQFGPSSPPQLLQGLEAQPLETTLRTTATWGEASMVRHAETKDPPQWLAGLSFRCRSCRRTYKASVDGLGRRASRSVPRAPSFGTTSHPPPPWRLDRKQRGIRAPTLVELTEGDSIIFACFSEKLHGCLEGSTCNGHPYSLKA